MNDSKYCVRTFSVLSLAILVAGCIPGVSTFYQPEALGGTVRSQGPCSAEIRRTLSLIVAEGIQIEALAAEEYKISTPIIYLRFSVRSSHMAQLTQPNIFVQTTSVDSIETYPIKALQAFIGSSPPTSQSATEPMRGAAVGDASRGDADGNQFTVEFNLTAIKPESFSLAVPDLLVDGKRVQVPAIKFTRISRMHLTALCQ